MASTAARFRRALLLVGVVLAACAVPDYGFNSAHTDASAGAAGTGAGGSSGDASSDSSSGGDAGGGGCSSNADCTSQASTPLCDTSAGSCVECLPGNDICPKGTYCVGTSCVVGCDEDEDCVPSGLGRPTSDGGLEAGAQLDGGELDAGGDAQPDAGVTLTCDLSKNLCVGCNNDWDCPIATICDVATSTCIPGCLDSSTCPTSFECCDNDCVNPQVTAAHCGACGAACEPDNATGKCVVGACEVDQCDTGFGNCNGQHADGCESPLATDPANCNGCGQACSPLANAQSACKQGTCSLGDCNLGYADCNAVASDGCEINLLASPTNCGSCSFACSLLNANAVCQAGACGIATCNAGYENCDNNVSNGCETNTQTSAQNCGACGTVCQFANAAASCSGGQCQLGTCAAPYANCDANAANGCETNLNTNTSHCGTCGKVCSSANGLASCNGGNCEISCTGAFANCDNNAINGCEVNTNTNANHCGSCGNACSNNNGTPSCSAGQCQINCTGGFGNCDNNASNGCEVNTNTNSSHCGSCGNACGANQTCQSGQCVTTGVTCTPPQADCNNNPGDGCEVNTNTNSSHCGSCGNACSAANAATTCSGGNCTISSCGAGYANCDGLYSNGCEVNTSSNVNSCGACGTVCTVANGTAACVNGSCAVASCNAGFANCDGLYSNGCEVNLNSSVSHCGTCGNACTNAHGGTACTAGACNPTCATGWGNCDGNANNGCETSLTTTSNCGTCGTSCSLTNATATCGSGSCQVSACTSGFGNCDGSHANGCETNTQTSVAHCGGCAQPCSGNNGTPSCSAGGCSIACNSGYGNCNNNARADGCEVNTTNNNSHCGACGTACGANSSCAASSCVCTTGFVTCGSNVCSCKGTGCCDGGTCQVEHDTGLGQKWYDCVAYGTYNSVQATKACQAWVSAHPGANSCASNCSGTAICSANGGNNAGACFGFGGAFVGRVYQGTGNNICLLSTDPYWDP